MKLKQIKLKNFRGYLENAFDISNMEQGYYLEGLVSRKKQIVPQIMDVIL